MTDLFGAEGRRRLAKLDVPEPWRSNATASVALIDDLEDQIAELNRRLRESHADHPYIPLLLSVPGIGWVLAFTIAAEIGVDISGSSRNGFPRHLIHSCGPWAVSVNEGRRRGLRLHGPGGTAHRTAVTVRAYFGERPVYAHPGPKRRPPGLARESGQHGT